MHFLVCRANVTHILSDMFLSSQGVLNVGVSPYLWIWSHASDHAEDEFAIFVVDVYFLLFIEWLGHRPRDMIYVAEEEAAKSKLVDAKYFKHHNSHFNKWHSPTWAVIVDGIIQASARTPCEQCGTLPEEGTSHKQCLRCRVPRYCSEDCQTRDWARHKVECRPWKDSLDTSVHHSAVQHSIFEYVKTYLRERNLASD